MIERGLAGAVARWLASTPRVTSPRPARQDEALALARSRPLGGRAFARRARFPVDTPRGSRIRDLEHLRSQGASSPSHAGRRFHKEAAPHGRSTIADPTDVPARPRAGRDSARPHGAARGDRAAALDLAEPGG